MNAVSVGVGPLSIDDVVNVARFDAPVELTDEALATIADTRHRIEELANDPTPVYGISTGFGALARRHIPKDLRAQLQRSLVRSHAAGSGPEVEREVVRALMLLRHRPHGCAPSGGVHLCCRAQRRNHSGGA